MNIRETMPTADAADAASDGLGPADVEAKRSPGVNSVVQALAILRFLARSSESHGVTAIARAIGINPSSAFNILKTLAAEKFVVFSEDSKRYALGSGARELAGVAIDSQKIFERIRHLLEETAEEFGATAGFWALVDDDRLVLAGLVESKGMMRIQMTVGQRMPAFGGATGRCYAANRKLDEATLRARFGALRWQSRPEFDLYVREVQAAAERGWAADVDRYIRGVATVASPILDAHGQARFFITHATFVGQLDDDKLWALGESSRVVAERAGAVIFG